MNTYPGSTPLLDPRWPNVGKKWFQYWSDVGIFENATRSNGGPTLVPMLDHWFANVLAHVGPTWFALLLSNIGIEVSPLAEPTLASSALHTGSSNIGLNIGYSNIGIQSNTLAIFCIHCLWHYWMPFFSPCSNQCHKNSAVNQASPLPFFLKHCLFSDTKI